MKKLVILCTLISFFTTSCSELTRPNNLENPQMQGWIYRNSIDQSLYEDITSAFIIEVEIGQKVIGGKRSLGDSERRAIDIFDQRTSWISSFESLQKDKWHEFAEKMLEGVWEKERIRPFMRELCQVFYSEFDDIAHQEFTVLNWEYDRDCQGDAYTGYLIEYEIGTGYYVLLQLIEYDNSNRYQYSILYQGRSFAEMKSLYI
ncbi:MAG: hypothetical protein IIX64_05165 [Bacteroidales bacterium]|nr:hypothetical protein [Bacteroidales bacterium]